MLSNETAGEKLRESVPLCLIMYRPQTLCKDVTGTSTLPVLAFCLPCALMFGILFRTSNTVSFCLTHKETYIISQTFFLQGFLAIILHCWRHKTSFQLIKKPETGFYSDRALLLILLGVVRFTDAPYL